MEVLSHVGPPLRQWACESGIWCLSLQSELRSVLDVVFDSVSTVGNIPQILEWLCEKSPSKTSVNWHTEHVTKPAQPMESDQYIRRGRLYPRKTI
ncbi:hypothetical protein CSKR_102387 [Clonorchis sinensis]|uniref:Uncharacterized protein n=1 Tax=Clonorchis sinensis TaxID=79923 RepID=A0A3R7DAN8_CLOSI|nr:hypothetical protein CSKR_102387 [Clonorchis sinensis]